MASFQVDVNKLIGMAKHKHANWNFEVEKQGIPEPVDIHLSRRADVCGVAHLVGREAWVFSRGRYYLGIVEKQGPKNLTVAYVSPGGIEAAEYHKQWCQDRISTGTDPWGNEVNAVSMERFKADLERPLSDSVHVTRKTSPKHLVFLA